MIREAQPGELAAVGDLRVAAYQAGGFLSPGYAPELRALGTQGDGTVLVAVPDDGPGDGPAARSGDGTAARSGDGTAANSGDGTAANSGDGTAANSGDGTAANSGDGTAANSGDGTAARSGDGPTARTAAGSGGGPGTGLSNGAGPIAGTIMLVTWPLAGELVGGPDEAEIRALAVAPGVQNGGVGTGLLLTALNWAELAGARRVVLSTLPEMRAAHRLYERNGFRRLPDRDWSPRPGVQLLAYSLELGSVAERPPD
jgi:ribosomal protein S18 acetylase RimI-like enzyme